MGSLSPSQACDGKPTLPLTYPAARRDDNVIDDYHGTSVADPYRWMENPDSDEVRAFVDAQAALTAAVLGECRALEPLRRELTKLYDHARYRPPFRRGSRYFYLHNSGLQPQSVLYVQEGLDGEAKVLLDPNALSDDGTMALSVFDVSEDGEHLAYGVTESGSDWVTAKVMRVADNTHLPDTLSWLKFTALTWTHDGRGFFYSRFPAPKLAAEADAGKETGANLNHALYYHFLGTEQAADVLCWTDPLHPRHLIAASVTDDGEYVLLEITRSCDDVNKLYYAHLPSLAGGIDGLRENLTLLPFVKLVDGFDARYLPVANDGPRFTFLTNKGAPRKKLVTVDVGDPQLWTEVLPEDDGAVLESAIAVNGSQLLVCFMSDVKHKLQIRELSSGALVRELPLEIGTVSGISGRRKDSEVFVGFTSFLTPGIVFRSDLAAPLPALEIHREIAIPGFDRSAFEARQVFYSSKDGTRIPMFIVARKNISLDCSHPALLYGYGGFNASVTPYFTVHRLVLMKNLGFVSCVANIRGGGEYGKEWHTCGALDKKQNCFDDFIAAAEFLVSSGYTCPSRLCIEGASNGGLLVAACINQRPDLFGCALAHVGVMDMLRFHRFTIGHAWTSDFGCSDNERQFSWLIKYSPLHNVRRPWEDGVAVGARCSLQYPATMLLTADHDDRVVPSHTYKLLATMQYELCTSMKNSPQTNPIVCRVDRKSGHGCGRPTKKLVDR